MDWHRRARRHDAQPRAQPRARARDVHTRHVHADTALACNSAATRSQSARDKQYTMPDCSRPWMMKSDEIKPARSSMHVLNLAGFFRTWYLRMCATRCAHCRQQAAAGVALSHAADVPPAAKRMRGAPSCPARAAHPQASPGTAMRARTHSAAQPTRSAAHRRFVRLKLERNTTQRCMHSCCTTSCCTRGVAVAVSASSGTCGYLCAWRSAGRAAAGPRARARCTGGHGTIKADA